MDDAKPDIRALFCEALDRNSPDELAEYLDAACGGDADLRAQVEELLASHREGGNFLGGASTSCNETLDQASLEKPGTQIGPYKLLEQIGEGGMGVVYVASQREPIRRKVALKIIKPGMDSRAVVARFEAERQALALMDHPNIAKVFDAGTTDAGRPYFVMELVKGTPITEFCDQHALAMRERLELFVTLCQGVQHAHQKGVIHRDLKPGNLLVEVHDVRPVPKIIDFGIAKAMGQHLTEMTLYTGLDQMVGTPLYMSPEQAGQSSVDVDTRSDIYSLGVLLYELLTGHTPFDKDTLRTAGVDEMRRLVREVDPPRPSVRVSTFAAAELSTISERRDIEPRKLRQQLRGDLDWIVVKALDKDRTRRYESASALATDVQRYLDDEPVQARPPSLLHHATKWVRRHRAFTWSATASAFVVAAVLAVSAWLLVAAYEREKQERAAADANAARADENSLQAAENAAKSQKNYEAARQAVRQMVTRVADEWLAEIPEMKDIRRRLLEDAAAFYTELLKLSPRDGLAYLERGQVFMALAEYEKARADYESAIELEPDNGSFHFALAVLCTKCPDITHRDAQRALISARRAVELEPRNCTYRRVLAWAYGDLGLANEAAAELKKGVELDPESGEAHEMLSEAYWNVGDYRHALTSIQKSIELSPHNAWAHLRLAELHLRLGDCAAALAAANKAIQQHGKPNDIATSWFVDVRGDIHWQLGNRAEALADWNKSLELAPFRPFTYKRRTRLYFESQSYDKALADIAKAVELNPGDGSNLWWIPPEEVAKCPDERLRQGLLELADKAIEKTQGAAEPYTARAMLYYAFGRGDEARADFDKVLALETVDTELWTWWAAVHARNPRWNEASAALSKLIELKPQQADHWYSRCLVRLGGGQVDAYREDCGAMLQRFSQTDEAYNAYRVAWACVLTPDAVRDWTTVVMLAEKAVQSDPKSALYLCTAGAAQYRAGQFDEALARLAEADATVEEPTKASRLSPAYIWFFLAMTHHRLGHAEDARQWLGKAIAWTDTVFSEADQGTTDLPWNRRLTLKLLRDEAATRLGVTPPSVESAPESAAKEEAKRE